MLLIEPAVQKNEDKEAENKELYEAFTMLGSAPELYDVEFAFFAQAEVALSD